MEFGRPRAKLNTGIFVKDPVLDLASRQAPRWGTANLIEDAYARPPHPRGGFLRMGFSGFVLVFGWKSQILAEYAAAEVAINRVRGKYPAKFTRLQRSEDPKKTPNEKKTSKIH